MERQRHQRVRLCLIETDAGRPRIFSSTRYGTEWPPENPNAAGLIGINFTWPHLVVYDIFASYKLQDTLLNFSIEYHRPILLRTACHHGHAVPARTARFGFTHKFGGDGLPTILAGPALGHASKARRRQLNRLICRRAILREISRGDIRHRENRRRRSGRQ